MEPESSFTVLTGLYISFYGMGAFPESRSSSENYFHINLNLLMSMYTAWLII